MILPFPITMEVISRRQNEIILIIVFLIILSEEGV